MPKGEYLQYGGQAIIEGVMMRSPNYFAVACRAPNGKIVVQTEPLEKSWFARQKWLKLPFIRGGFALFDAMALGMKSMKFATNVQMKPELQPITSEEQAAQAALSEAEKKRQEKIQNGAVVGTMIFSFAIGLLLFNYLPNFLTEMFSRLGIESSVARNILAEFIKLVILILYLWLISRLEGIREVFKYHGAEHKAINAMEANQELTIETCQAQTRFHPRCGTSFMVIVFIIGFLIFPFVPRYPITGQAGNWWIDVPVRVGVELLILPIIAGIAYEAIRFAGKMRNQKAVMWAFQPGLWTQRITTVEPDTPHVEVALVSLRAVQHAEQTGECLIETGIVEPEAVGEPEEQQNPAPAAS